LVSTQETAQQESNLTRASFSYSAKITSFQDMKNNVQSYFSDSSKPMSSRF